MSPAASSLAPFQRHDYRRRPLAKRRVVLEWRETGGPPVAQPAALGFGTSLIERAIPGAKVRQEFHRDGFVCAIELPEGVIVAPLTSQIRGARGEVPLGKPSWLPKTSAVNVQGLASFDPGKLARRLGKLSDEQMSEVKGALRDLLDL